MPTQKLCYDYYFLFCGRRAKKGGKKCIWCMLSADKQVCVKYNIRWKSCIAVKHWTSGITCLIFRLVGENCLIGRLNDASTVFLFSAGFFHSFYVLSLIRHRGHAAVLFPIMMQILQAFRGASLITPIIQGLLTLKLHSFIQKKL